MGEEILRKTTKLEYNEEEEAEAAVNIWKYVFGFTEMAVVKCAIDLGIADVLEKNGGSMSLSDLSCTLRCPQSYLYRVMRFLTHRKIFKQIKTSQDTVVSYAQTPLSRHLMSGHSLAPLIMLESSPVMLAPWLRLSRRVRDDQKSELISSSSSPFEDAHGGETVWSYAANNPGHSKLINEAMASDARVVVPQMIKECPKLFDGVGSVVDVGGGDGTALSILVEAFPWIEGINFDVPHVVSNATVQSKRLKHVGGDMFVNVPKADVVFLKWILHDWNDEECIEILKKCREAIADKERGKMIIVEAVIEEDEDNNHNKLKDVGLMLDMVMMAHTNSGKERTLKEWNHLLNKAGFRRVHVNPIQAVQSVIEAYP